MENSNETNIPIEDAKFLRDQGIAMSIDSANAQNPLWQYRALEALQTFIKTHRQQFMTEDFRRWAETKGNLPSPPTGRAYGAVMTTAFKQHIINHNGYGPTTNPKSHRTPASIWIVNEN
jgi:hypothetical protein